MYLLASDLKEKSIDDVDMTPVYNYSSDDNKISIEYSDDAWYFIDQLAAFKFGKIDGKKYFFDSQYSNFIVGEPRVEMGVDSKYVTLTGAPMNVQSSQTEYYDEKTGELTGEVVNLYSVDGKINDRSGILFFSDVSGEGLRFLTFVETSMLYDGYDDVDDEEKDKIVKRAVRKIHKDFEEDGEIDQENTDLDYDLYYSNDLKVNTDAATALYIGMVTDSGRFRFDSTTPRTFNIAAKLLESKIDLLDIYNKLYNDDLESVSSLYLPALSSAYIL